MLQTVIRASQFKYRYYYIFIFLSLIETKYIKHNKKFSEYPRQEVSMLQGAIRVFQIKGNAHFFMLSSDFFIKA